MGHRISDFPLMNLSNSRNMRHRAQFKLVVAYGYHTEVRSSILFYDHPAGLTRIQSDYCLITALLPECLLRIREDGPHMDAIVSIHRLKTLLTLSI